MDSMLIVLDWREDFSQIYFTYYSGKRVNNITHWAYSGRDDGD